MNHLELYIMLDCPTCQRAVRVAERLALQFPELLVEVIDLDAPSVAIPGNVFAAPTFRLNGGIISLGTPDWETVVGRVRGLSVA